MRFRSFVLMVAAAVAAALVLPAHAGWSTTPQTCGGPAKRTVNVSTSTGPKSALSGARAGDLIDRVMAITGDVATLFY